MRVLGGYIFTLEFLAVVDLIGLMYVIHLWGPYVVDCILSVGR